MLLYTYGLLTPVLLCFSLSGWVPSPSATPSSSSPSSSFLHPFLTETLPITNSNGLTRYTYGLLTSVILGCFLGGWVPSPSASPYASSLFPNPFLTETLPVSNRNTVLLYVAIYVWVAHPCFVMFFSKWLGPFSISLTIVLLPLLLVS